MMIKYFKDIDILNIELHKGEFGYSEEIAEGVIFDISREGEILSIEVLNVAKKEKMRLNKLPPGWNEERMQRVLAHYESQTDKAAAAEDEAAYDDSGDTLMQIPY